MSLAAVSFDPSTRRVHSLDGLRAVSAGLVMVSHLGLAHLVPGGLGVTCFFFISGFIITRLLLAEIDRTDSVDLAGFYRRRFWRLWPAIAAAVLGVVLIGLAFGEVWAPAGHVASSLAFVQNYWSMVAPASNPLNIHWSLAVEFHFYLLWPVALLSLLSRRPSAAVPTVAAALVGCLMSRLVSALLFQHWDAPQDFADNWTYKLSHMRADSILFGALLALMAYQPQHRRLVEALARERSIWLGLAVLLATLAFRDELFRATARYSVQGAGLFLVFAGVLFAERGGPVRWLLNRPIMAWLGAVSFSVYLWHMTLWRAVRQVTGLEGGLAPALATVALTLLAAWLSYRFVEQRGIALGQRRSRPRRASTTATRLGLASSAKGFDRHAEATVIGNDGRAR